MAVLEESIKFWESERLGYSDPSAWKTSQEFMQLIGLVDMTTDVEEMFSNQFIIEP